MSAPVHSFVITYTAFNSHENEESFEMLLTFDGVRESQPLVI
jgi:hypothetical protein